MGKFFIGWELWQEMTFVLGCCIVIVFGLGLAKLWWANRIMRRLEEIDEEKRARRSELRYCGMTSDDHNDTPFGVRALQCGIEVDGIWIARHDASDISQVASSATLIGDQADSVKFKKRRLASSSEGSRTGSQVSGLTEASSGTIANSGPSSRRSSMPLMSHPKRFALVAEGPPPSRSKSYYVPASFSVGHPTGQMNYTQKLRTYASAVPTEPDAMSLEAIDEHQHHQGTGSSPSRERQRQDTQPGHVTARRSASQEHDQRDCYQGTTEASDGNPSQESQRTKLSKKLPTSSQR